MLNFREELGKIIEEKRIAFLTEEKEKSVLVEDVLKDFLDKLKEKDFLKLSTANNFKFESCIEAIYVYQVTKHKTYRVMRYTFKDSNEANIVIRLLEKRFKNEGYEIVDNTSVQKGYFNVIIKP